MNLTEEKKILLKRYAELGFHVFPCYQVRGVSCSCPNSADCLHAGKHPKTGWTKSENCASTYEEMVKMFSSEHFNANIAVNCTLSNIWVVDIDTKNDSQGAESFQELVEDYGLPPLTLQHTTPSGGFHVFFQQRDDVKIGTTTNAYPGIDIRGVGGYVLLPPSIAPANDWKKDSEKRTCAHYVLRENGTKSISKPNDKWFNAFNGLTPRANDHFIDRSTVTLQNEDDNTRNPELSDWAELERCLSHIPSDCINVPNQDPRAYITYFKILGGIADACPGKDGLDLAIRWSAATCLEGGSALNYHNPSRVSYEFCRARNGNEKKVNSVGGKVSSFKTIFKIAKDCGCPANLDWWGQQIGQFRKTSIDSPIPKEGKNPDIAVTEFLRFKKPIIDLDVTEDLKFGQDRPPTMPDLQLKGAVLYAYNFINSVNRVEAPLLSVLPAICTVASATNRSFSMGNLRTVMYGVNIAEAGGGKQAGIDGSEQLIESINCERFLLGDPKSSSAFSRQISDNPNTYWVVDEIADKLKPMFDERAGGYTKEIVPLLLKAYSVGGGTLGRAVYKDAENDIESVKNPHLNIFGAMVDIKLAEIIKRDQVNSGFVRRFLLNWSPAGIKKDIEEVVTPDYTQLELFNSWYDELYKQTSLGNLAALKGTSKVIELDVGDKNHYREQVAIKDAALDKIPEEFRPLYQSWEENVKKVGMVLCAGDRHRNPTSNLILPEDIETAAKVVTNSCDTWLYYFRHHIYENDIDKYAKLLVQELNSNKKEGVRIPDFRARKKITKRFLYEDVIDMLIENGGVYLDTQVTRTINNRRRNTDYLWNINYLPDKIKAKLSEHSEDIASVNKRHLQAVK